MVSGNQFQYGSAAVVQQHLIPMPFDPAEAHAETLSDFSVGYAFHNKLKNCNRSQGISAG
jgi:hypothetical protein